MGRVIATCVSEIRGIPKRNIHRVTLREDYGIEGDAHAGNWHRQVSLLSWEKIEAFRRRGAVVEDGAFGENLVVEGIDFKALPIGTRFACGEAVLELTQIGKECHRGCAIFQQMGDCIMPREGVFARVLRGGEIKEGDQLEVSFIPFRVAVITASDAGSRGEREDKSAPVIEKMVREAGFSVVSLQLYPDDQERLARAMRDLCDRKAVDLILTTGGTGFSPRDVTPEATLSVIERAAPGIPEAMRYYSLQITGRAMLSRAQAGIRGETLIVNLPGSPRAVEECLGSILPHLTHGLEILTGRTSNCART